MSHWMEFPWDRFMVCQCFPHVLPGHLLWLLGRGWQGLAAQDGCFLSLQPDVLYWHSCQENHLGQLCLLELDMERAGAEGTQSTQPTSPVGKVSPELHQSHASGSSECISIHAAHRGCSLLMVFQNMLHTFVTGLLTCSGLFLVPLQEYSSPSFAKEYFAPCEYHEQ